MNRIRRPAPFAILSTGHGTMIVNRNDYRMVDESKGFGVGLQLFRSSLFDPDEVDLALKLLELRRATHGDGLVALDCGANIGVHTIEWARAMTGWGSVVAFEPQERIYYALAGNIAINNCLNARALHAAVGARTGTIAVPELDYTQPASYGSLEIKPSARSDFIGQAVDYEGGSTTAVNIFAIDDLDCERLDFVKLDVEGMELEALQGARRSIARFQPLMLVEHVKAAPGTLEPWLEALGYRCIMTPMNILAVHQDDPALAAIQPD